MTGYGVPTEVGSVIVIFAVAIVVVLGWFGGWFLDTYILFRNHMVLVRLVCENKV
jgi:hypothetical protein